MSKTTEIKAHTLNLINALANLSPSRNIISQLILLLPKDLATIEHSYPEVSSPEAREILERYFGLKFGDIVKREENSFAASLYEIIHSLFDWLDDEFTYEKSSQYGEAARKIDVRSSLAKLTGVHVSSIPNPYSEWAKLVLKKLLSRPNGDKILDFLKMLLKHESFIVDRRGYSRGARQPDWELFLSEVREKLKVDPVELEEIKRHIIGVPEYSGSKRSKDATVNILHSEYHLDLIISIQRTHHHWYDHLYELRHKSTLEELLGEVSYERTSV